MVSKLALAAYEVVLDAIETKQDKALTEQLKEHYYEIVKGIGAHKSPVNYVAFLAILIRTHQQEKERSNQE